MEPCSKSFTFHPLGLIPEVRHWNVWHSHLEFEESFDFVNDAFNFLLDGSNWA